MKVVIAHRTGQPKVVDLPEPKPGRNFVTVRISHSAMILPDELEVLESAPRMVPKGQDGVPLGATSSGTVVECGAGVRRIKAGLRVAVAGLPYVYHAAQLVVPENLCVELPKKVNHEEGAFVGQGAQALHLLRVAGVQLGEVVAVMGADVLGLLAAQLVRAAGAIPILIDDSDFRLRKASPVGVVDGFTPASDKLMGAVDVLTEGHGVDAVLLTRRRVPGCFAMATKLARHGGVIVVGAPLGEAVAMDLVQEKGLDVRSALGSGPGYRDADFEVHNAGYPRALARWTARDNMVCFAGLLAERRVQVSPLVTDRIPLERAATAYDKVARGRESAVGVVLTL